MKIAVGDVVRIHFHPPGPMKSFSEGVVRRVDVATPEGDSFVVEVTHEVILDREHRIRPGFHDYIRYECRSDFPGRIEILSTAGQDIEKAPPEELVSVEPPNEAREEPADPPEDESAPFEVLIERQPAEERKGIIATLFRWQK